MPPWHIDQSAGVRCGHQGTANGRALPNSREDLVNRGPQLMEWAIGKGCDLFRPDTRKLIVPGEKTSWDQQELDVPIGPNNRIEPGGPDMGQPTHFRPGRRTGVFVVAVPQGIHGAAAAHLDDRRSRTKQQHPAPAQRRLHRQSVHRRPDGRGRRAHIRAADQTQTVAADKTDTNVRTLSGVTRRAGARVESQRRALGQNPLQAVRCEQRSLKFSVRVTAMWRSWRRPSPIAMLQGQRVRAAARQSA